VLESTIAAHRKPFCSETVVRFQRHLSDHRMFWVHYIGSLIVSHGKSFPDETVPHFEKHLIGYRMF
jgi:hypothetical protein